jgi:hypothetical protein
MVFPVFLYTRFMNDTATMFHERQRMAFEWKHTKEDHTLILAFQMELLSETKYMRAVKNRTRIILLPPLVLISILGFISGGVWGAIGGALVFLMIYFVMLFVGKLLAGSYGPGASSMKRAAKYVEYEKNIPIGTHRLSVTDKRLEWYWHDGEEATSFPMHRIDEAREYEGRLFLIRDGGLKGSIPFYAFGDQETRRAFVKVVNDSRNEMIHD